MAVNQTYHTCFQWLRQLWPESHCPPARNAAWFLAGLYESHSVQLQAIARRIPGQAKLPSRIRHLARFLASAHLRVRPSYAPIAQALLQDLAQTLGEIRLIADGSRVAFHHQLLLVSVAYRRRAVPIAWTWIPSARGHSGAWQQLALLAYVHGLLPPSLPVSLVGDAEFGAVEVQEQVDAWHWTFVLRQKSNNQVRRGLRHTRCLGEALRSLQRLWTAAVVNLKRLFRLAEQRSGELRRLLVGAGKKR